MLSAPKTLRRKNFKHLQLSSTAEAPQPALPSFPKSDDNQKLMAGVEFQLHPEKNQNLETIAELGEGNGGSVSKVRHVSTGTIIAKKVIYLETNATVQKSIRQELEILKRCDSEFIVRYFGQYVESHTVTILMEYMDCGSLDKIYKRIGPLEEQVIAAINAAVVDGITYLKTLDIAHRDLKPSNILVNSKGEIKLCDFGVSGVLVNSIAETFVGTSTYMSPERIIGATYSATGDVWSLGLSLVELALGRFPFDMSSGSGIPPPIFELLTRIVNEPPPRLPTSFSKDFQVYIERCLQPEANSRMSLQELPKSNFYVRGSQSGTLLREWAKKLSSV